MRQIILASNSPRRRQLLAEAGYDFQSRNTDFDEQFQDHWTPVQTAEHLAVSKNDHYRNSYSDEILITADTIVVRGKRILAKASNRDEAKEMLSALSDGTHQVITGVCISGIDEKATFHDTTIVHFDRLNEKEIDYYIKRCQPFDKAGAYGIQDWIGLTRIPRIEGSYFNVMGLPINQVYEVLKNQFGITPYPGQI